MAPRCAVALGGATPRPAHRSGRAAGMRMGSVLGSAHTSSRRPRRAQWARTAAVSAAVAATSMGAKESRGVRASKRVTAARRTRSRQPARCSTARARCRKPTAAPAGGA